MAWPFQRTGSSFVELGKRLRDRYFPANTVLADSGDVLLDEQSAIALRREIVAGPPPARDSLAEAHPASTGKPRRQESNEKLDRYYAAAHPMKLSALCLSGGGIRSAAFALGVVQGLAQRNLLQRFDYLSTVSGGGYVGSFLATWVQRYGYPAVCEELAGNVPPGSPLRYLRSYSSYLTPERGPFTADTLSVVAIYVRNLLLNWLIIIPLVLAVLVAIKAAAVMIWSLPSDPSVSSPLMLLAIYTAGIAVTESLRQRPGWESTRSTPGQFQLMVKWMVFASGMALSIVALKYLQHANELVPPPLPRAALNVLPDVSFVQSGNPDASVEILRSDLTLLGSVTFPAVAMAAINFISWMIAYFISRNPDRGEISTRSTVRSNNKAAVGNLASFTLSGFVAGAFLGCLFYVLSRFWHFDMVALIAFCLGPPAVVAALFLGETVHIGLTSTTQWSDGEREWLATAAGYHGRIAVVWMVLTFVVFTGSYVVFYLGASGGGWLNSLFSLGTTGTLAGLIVAWLGKASATAATLRERYNTWTNWSASIILAIATPVFLIITVSFLSAGIDYAVLGEALSFSVAARGGAINPVIDVFPLQGTELDVALLARLFLALLACVVVFCIAAWAINTNRFSLHGLYRNRLIRAFLGGSRKPEQRKPNALSQFDENDNINLVDLWPNRSPPPGSVPPQFLVVNCALNVLRSSNLAWQERKALSFTCTPRWVGSAALDDGAGGYRRSGDYGSRHDGISLGTAMTISGAAVSPNMGYHSSPALSVLMTFFNVRLGAWLGNPGPGGARVINQEGPRFSALPLVQEALGLTTEDKSYVYLSDGGHFENLGLYEMVRRRCHFIVLSDAGCDPQISFEDLGNAVRRISIDLNVKIEFDALKIAPRKKPPEPGGYVAVGRIIYPESSTPGHLLYVKPSYRGTEPASVRAYAEANPAFPHEPTTDQMFGESQFEAYRALGEYVVQTVDGKKGPHADVEAFINAVQEHLSPKTNDIT